MLPVLLESPSLRYFSTFRLSCLYHTLRFHFHDLFSDLSPSITAPLQPPLFSAWQDSSNVGISIPTDALASGGSAGHDDPHGSRGGANDGQARRSSRSRSPGDRGRSEESNNPGNNLHVSSLSYKVDSRDLESAFAKIGRVAKASVVYDPHTRESRLFGFVTMESAEEADAAIAALNGTDFMGKTITVAKANRICLHTHKLSFDPHRSTFFSSFPPFLSARLPPNFFLGLISQILILLARRGRARTPTPGRYHGPGKRRDGEFSSLLPHLPPSLSPFVTHTLPPVSTSYTPFPLIIFILNLPYLPFFSHLLHVQVNAATTPDPTTLGTPGITTTAIETDGVDDPLVTMMTVEEGVEVVIKMIETETEVIDEIGTETIELVVVVVVVGTGTGTGTGITIGGIDVVHQHEVGETIVASAGSWSVNVGGPGGVNRECSSPDDQQNGSCEVKVGNAVDVQQTGSMIPDVLPIATP
ncbi:hypothetical protein D9758_008933 [Tetrapyrgos nigripes]|uniref:RRM domain-containing protein n=1 Tax=Tetrapyrgos nigripes TaxID=182062 RepID=A0A8H5LRC4_9AGAR|nr:hypothetical protein D9758_008933 [Tetrapyrgos nigripes]